MTEPLIASDVDLRDFPFMPVDVRRLLTSETWLTATGDEKAAAMTLWLESWHQVPAGSLPDNDRMLSILSQAGGKWRKIRAAALNGWVKCSDGRLYHPVVCEKAQEAWERKQAQRQRTAAARQARLNRTATDDKTETVTGSVTETVTSSKGQGQGQGQGKEKNEPIGSAAEPPKVVPFDARKALFDDGLPMLAKMTGKPPDKCRSLVGKWLKAAGDDAQQVHGLIRKAAENQIAEAVPWIERALEPPPQDWREDPAYRGVQ